MKKRIIVVFTNHGGIGKVIGGLDRVSNLFKEDGKIFVTHEYYNYEINDGKFFPDLNNIEDNRNALILIHDEIAKEEFDEIFQIETFAESEIICCIHRLPNFQNELNNKDVHPNILELKEGMHEPKPSCYSTIYRNLWNFGHPDDLLEVTPKFKDFNELFDSFFSETQQISLLERKLKILYKLLHASYKSEDIDIVATEINGFAETEFEVSLLKHFLVKGLKLNSEDDFKNYLGFVEDVRNSFGQEFRS